MPSNLLCATDGSKQAEKAIAYAVKQAKKSDASLTFLNVVTVSSERAARTYFWDQKSSMPRRFRCTGSCGQP
jgi:nucleotide-binding universal stress UspA family protein